jgi:hypothetical protein
MVKVTPSPLKIQAPPAERNLNGKKLTEIPRMLKPLVSKRLGLLAIFFFAGSYAHSFDLSPATLSVCNQGTIAVNVVIGIQADLLFGDYLDVDGWRTLDPGECKEIYHRQGDPQSGAPRAYLGFGFSDSHGRFRPGYATQLPNLGQFPFGTQVLASANDRFCVRDAGMVYRIPEHASLDCASFRSSSSDQGGYTSFPTVLRFYPIPRTCSSPPFGGAFTCSGGEYYLNVKATADSSEIKIWSGIGKNQEPPAGSSSNGVGLGNVMKSIGDAAVAERKKKEKAEAEAQAAGRQNVTVCVPEALDADWRNPAPGSKMEKFKTHFKHALEVHAENSESDMTAWWWIDGRVFATYDPAGPLGKVVVSDQGGSCGLNSRREMFAINP